MLACPAFFAGALASLSAATEISLVDGRWFINGRITNPGSAAEGLLMNARMVNATFEDRNKPDFNAEANTDAFIAQIPNYAAHGINAFTFSLQGGNPEYEGALNSAFDPDGSLRPEYLRRVERVLRTCDQHGVAAILTYYYQRQSKILRDDDAIRAGVDNATRWLLGLGLKNVLVEVANEYAHGGYASQPLIRSGPGQASLLRRVKALAPQLLVTTSGYANARIEPEVAAACDFLAPHWNLAKTEDIPERIRTLRGFGKAIVCNEDLKTGEDQIQALRVAVKHGAGHGIMEKHVNQTFPFRFEGAADNPAYYTALLELTSPPAPVIRARGGEIAFEAENGSGNWKRIATPTGSAVQDPGYGRMYYDIEFTEPGKYYVFLFARQGEAGRNKGKENDVALTLGGEKLYGSDHKTRPTGIRSSGDWKWGKLPKGPGGHTPDAIRNDPVYFLVREPGRLRFEMAHRSENFAVDKIVLKRDNPEPPK
jgi:hypothetical protein